MDLPKFPENSMDEEWLLINAIRQALGISHRRMITYADAIALALDLAPKLISEDSEYVEGFESSIISLYKARAKARSIIEGRSISPLDILTSEIDGLKEEQAESEGEPRELITRQLSRRLRAKEMLKVSRWTESQVISRDADAFTNLPVSHKGQGYKEYYASDGRILRVRVLHPDPPEARSGVDLIYETYWKRVEKTTDLVRIVALQYKMWDGKALYTSKAPNLRRQMEKMRKCFCDSKFCDRPNVNEGDERYRLPYCCAFLRPTDRIQTRNAWQVTRAWHVPICVALEDLEPTEAGNEVLRSKQISCKSMTQGTFQELYNRSMLGSRWMSPVKLGELYDQIGIFHDLDRVVVHAQEYSP